MRLTPWRAMPPKDAISGLDRDRLEKRLAKLVGGPDAGATHAPAQVDAAIVPDPGKPAPGGEPDGGTTALVEVGVVLDAVALPVQSQKPGNGVEIRSGERKRRRRRKAGFLLFFGGMILVLFLGRANPAARGSGAFPVSAPGHSAGPASSLHFPGAPHGALWRRVTHLDP